MYGFAEARPGDRPGPFPRDFDDEWGRRREFGLRGPLTILAVVAAFWLFRPLGVALLVYAVWRAVRRGGGCGFRRGSVGRWGRPAFRNAAFDEHRRETLRELDQEADAFDDFERRRREAQDRADFERFLAERNVPKGGPDPQ